MSTTLHYARDQVDHVKSAVALHTLIGETLPLVRDGRLYVARCPFHTEKTPSFVVYPDHWHCFGCGARGDVVDWLVRARGMSFVEAMTHLGGTPAGGRPQVTQSTPKPAAAPATLAAAQRVWREAIDARGTLAERYLQGRGLHLPHGVALRFHPECRRGGRDSRGCVSLWPAMIALMVDPTSGKGVGIHRTFLAPDGTKAPSITRGNIILPSKSILGGWGSFRVPAANETRGTLAISEGLENALSAQLLLQWEWSPIWAAGCAANLATFSVLPLISTLTVFADNDPVGIKAAQACEARWLEAGRHVELQFPPRGHDWNSALRERAAR
jgi:DNA primase